MLKKRVITTHIIQGLTEEDVSLKFSYDLTWFPSMTKSTKVLSTSSLNYSNQ